MWRIILEVLDTGVLSPGVKRPGPEAEDLRLVPTLTMRASLYPLQHTFHGEKIC
jgi:hypothetical protein